MNRIIRTIAVTFGTLVVTGMMAVGARAQCGASDGHLASNSATALLMHSGAKTAAASAKANAIAQSVAPGGAQVVGFWHVTFISKGTGFIPDGTVVDQGFSQWHSDADGDSELFAATGNQQFLPGRLGKDGTFRLQAESLCAEFGPERQHDWPSEHSRKRDS
jgi:hypothetical protein